MSAMDWKSPLAIIACLWMTCAMGQPVSVQDLTGRTVELPAPAARIVALAPHSVENLFSAGAGTALVGVTEYSNYPPAARRISRIGSFNAYSLEMIAALQPDLIVMWASGNGMQTMQALQVLDIPIFVSEPRQLADIPRAIRALGLLAGTRTVSEPEAQRIEAAIEALRRQYGGRDRVSVFYEIWNEPLQTINGDHLISQVIELCGGSNIFADAPTLAPRISVESVLARNPRAIVASGMGEARPEWLDQWRNYPSLDAVIDEALFFINPDHIQRPTARVLLGAARLCEQLDSLRPKK